MRWPSRSDCLGSNRSIASGPYQLIEYDSQRAFDRDFRAATTRGPQRGSRVGVPSRGPHRARLRGGVRAERPGSESEKILLEARPKIGKEPRVRLRSRHADREFMISPRPAETCRDEPRTVTWRLLRRQERRCRNAAARAERNTPRPPAGVRPLERHAAPPDKEPPAPRLR